jgi:Protein of unknown function (DUF2743).
MSKNNLSKISANTLFHFTKKRETLVSILENTFYPRYCWENISTIEQNNQATFPDFAVPIVSFCDIPLSQVGDHVKTYGNFAIGLKKEWGVKNGLNPVFYIEPKSDVAKDIRKIADISSNALSVAYKAGASIFIELGDGLTQLAIYTKLHKGRFFRGGVFEPEIFNFYDEREWRYVPRVKKIRDLNVSRVLTWGFAKKPGNELIFDNWNNVIKKANLNFEPDDVKYIIVEKEGDILTLANELKRIKSRFSEDQIILLTTRLISMENIKEDF